MIALLIRVVIDTNVWISALINPSGEPARIMQVIRDRRIHFIVSPPLLTEMYEVVQRRRIRSRIRLTDRELDAFLAEIRELAVMVTIHGEVSWCRDVKDNIVVETAIQGGAAYIVSRDEDLTRDLNLVAILQDLSIEAVTVARFLQLLDAEPTS